MRVHRLQPTPGETLVSHRGAERSLTKKQKGVAFGGTRTHANKVDYDLNVAP
jgi:hypothetical protein